MGTVRKALFVVGVVVVLGMGFLVAVGLALGAGRTDRPAARQSGRYAVTAGGETAAEPVAGAASSGAAGGLAAAGPVPDGGPVEISEPGEEPWIVAQDCPVSRVVSVLGAEHGVRIGAGPAGSVPVSGVWPGYCMKKDGEPPLTC